jgi:hypothetical protein
MGPYGKRPREEEAYDGEEGDSAAVPGTTAAVVQAALAEEKAAKVAKGGGARKTLLPTKKGGDNRASQFVVEGEDGGADEEGPIKEVSQTASAQVQCNALRSVSLPSCYRCCVTFYC